MRSAASSASPGLGCTCTVRSWRAAGPVDCRASLRCARHDDPPLLFARKDVSAIVRRDPQPDSGARIGCSLRGFLARSESTESRGGAKSRGCRGRRSPSGPDSPLLPPLFRSFAVRSCREVQLIPLFERASRDAELPERPTHAGRPHEPARAFVVVGEVRGGFPTGFASRSSSALGAAFRSDRRQGLAPLFRPSTSCVRCGRSTAWSGGRKLSACCRICRAVRRCIRGW